MILSHNWFQYWFQLRLIHLISFDNIQLKAFCFAKPLKRNSWGLRTRRQSRSAMLSSPGFSGVSRTTPLLQLRQLVSLSRQGRTRTTTSGDIFGTWQNDTWQTHGDTWPALEEDFVPGGTLSAVPSSRRGETGAPRRWASPERTG